MIDKETSLEKRSFIRRGQWGPPIRIPEKVDRYDSEAIAKMWNISVKRAKETIKVTTQEGIRNLTQPITRRLKTQKWRNRKVLKGRWFADTMKFKVPSIIRNDTDAQIFTNGKGYVTFYPVRGEK